jgi:hypothetical protein
MSAVSGRPEEIVMRASLLLAGLTVLSISSANAAAVPCRNVLNFASYGDCADKVRAMGWTGNDVWWYCSDVDFKK